MDSVGLCRSHTSYTRRRFGNLPDRVASNCRTGGRAREEECIGLRKLKRSTSADGLGVNRSTTATCIMWRRIPVGTA